MQSLWSSLPVSALALACGLLVGTLDDALANPGRRYVPLYTWFNEDRGDYFTTTHPNWREPSEGPKDGYGFFRREGWLIAPEEGPGPDLQPVYGWYSDGWKDNFITTDPRWRGAPGDRESPDYHFVRIEGYVYTRPMAGTIPLHSWYSDGREDNFATTDTRWWGDIGARKDGYRLFRREGWIVAPDAFGERDRLGDLGYRSDPINRALRTLLVLVQFTDAGFANPNTYDRRWFGPGAPNVAGLIDKKSYGMARLRRTGFAVVTVPMTRAQADALTDRSHDPRVLRLANGQFDYSDLDRNGDNRLTSDEALIIILNAAPNRAACGQQRGAPNLTLDGVDISGAGFAAIDEFAHWHIMAEEVSHTFGFVDLYGPGLGLNARASYMGDACNTNILSSVGPYGLDPWHKLRAGWLAPRAYPLSRSAGTAMIRASDQLSANADKRFLPLILFDPTRGFDEFFMVEFRDPTGSTYDAGALSRGVAVWYVNRRNESSPDLESFDWPPPFTRHVRGGNMNAAYYIGTSGPSQGNFFAKRDTVSLVWGDGTDSKFRLRVADMYGDVAFVSWWHDEETFKSRIDDVFMHHQGGLGIIGQFPPATVPLRAVLTKGGLSRTVDLPAAPRRSGGNDTFLEVALTEPLPSGTWRVVVRLPDEPDSLSNAVDVQIP